MAEYSRSLWWGSTRFSEVFQRQIAEQDFSITPPWALRYSGWGVNGFFIARRRHCGVVVPVNEHGCAGAQVFLPIGAKALRNLRKRCQIIGEQPCLQFMAEMGPRLRKCCFTRSNAAGLRISPVCGVWESSRKYSILRREYQPAPDHARRACGKRLRVHGVVAVAVGADLFISPSGRVKRMSWLLTTQSGGWSGRLRARPVARSSMQFLKNLST